MGLTRAILLLTGAGLLVPAAPAQEGLKNPDFEEGQVGRLPPGWFVPTPGYTAVITKTRPEHGQQCAQLSSDGTDDQAPFGNLMQSFDATPYRGKRIRVLAAVRVVIASVEDQAQFWLRVDRPDGQMGFFDDMADRPIRDIRWDYYEIVADVAGDAQTINLGLMLLSNGRAWLDDVSLRVIGDADEQAGEGPRPLQGRALENLVAFTKLLGYVRFFHPSDEAARTHWDDFAIVGVPAVEDAQDAADLAQRLQELFQPIAPTLRVFPTSSKPPLPEQLSPPKNVKSPELTYWRHTGVGLGGPRLYHSRRQRKTAWDGKLPDEAPDPGKPFVAELGGGVSASVPLALWLDQKGTIPRAKETDSGDSPTRGLARTGNDRTTRLAVVTLAWNIFQHFYPYFDVVQTDWPAALRTALTAAATDLDQRAFLDTLRRLVAELHDGHGGVHHRSDICVATLPLLWDWIEGRLVVTRVADSAPAGTLRPGNVVLEVDGRAAAAALAEVEQFISAATPQWKRHRGLRELARGQTGEKVALKIERRDGQVTSVTLKRAASAQPLQETRSEKVAEVRPGVMYLDLGRINDDDFKQALPQLETAAGIVFDLRGYPRSLSPVVIAHLIDQPVTCAQWHVPVVTRPDRENMKYRFSNWNVEPAKPRLTAKVAFIIDGRAISYAETYLGIIEHYKLAEMVGGPTAGTNGNVNPFTLPGGYNVAWTGMRVLKHDGSQHHGIGIRPTVPVGRTIAGVRAGRDELLEKAIQVVSP